MLPPPAGGTVGPPPDGPQWVLDQWGNASNNTYNENVFRFVRLEDLAYDKRPGKSNVLYLIDPGRGTAGAPGANVSTNGRVWKMVLDKKDPTKVKSLEILIEGDDQAVKTLTEIHQPDNIESTKRSLLITEDPGSSQQFPPGSADPNATTARLWHVPFAEVSGAGTPSVVLRIDQGADGGPTDVDGRPNGNWGAWETSGIVDASSAFGPDTSLLNIQAHTLWVEKAPGDDNNRDGQPDFTYKREGGQLLLLRIPGA